MDTHAIQLALYKSEQYLSRLQGDVVPPVIGVHVLPGEICVSMEPPHPSFWMEASADMPDVLKEKCIEAYEKIHSQGVLHGDVELRHMLIGADGRVTIIDFQASRSLVSNEAVMLKQAEPAEFNMEMRKVKYKLNYKGARQRELNKVTTCEKRSHRNRLRRAKHERRARGERVGYISDYEEDPEQDKIEPPVHKQDWNEHWTIAADAIPRRFVMPGQTSQHLEREIQLFLEIVDRMGKETVSCQIPPPLLSGPPIDAASGSKENSAIEVPSQPAAECPTHKYWLRKRKDSTVSPLTVRPSKRARSSRDSSTTPTLLSSYDIRGNTHRRRQAPPAYHTAAISRDQSAVISSSLTDDLTTAAHATPAQLPRTDTRSVYPAQPLGAKPRLYTHRIRQNPSKAGSSESGFPPIKARDFAYESHSGPRGYYVPHPPTEARAAFERARYIAMVNVLRCRESDLPHPVILAQQGRRVEDDEVQRVHLQARKKPIIQMGNLKRAREDMDDPDGVREWAARKKARYEFAKRARNGERATRKRKRDKIDGQDELEGYMTSDEMPGVQEGPKILTKSEYIALETSNQGSGGSSSSGPRSILRKTTPVKTISHDRDVWLRCNLEKSPKLGPQEIHASELGQPVMLGVHYDSSPPPGIVGSSLSGARRIHHSLKSRSGERMALATLGMSPPVSWSQEPKSVKAVPVSSPQTTIDLTLPEAPLVGSGAPQVPKRLPPPRTKIQSRSAHGAVRRPFKIIAIAQPLHQARHPSPTLSEEEEEVEALVRPDVLPVCTPTVHSLQGWMGLLLRFL